MRSDVLVGGSSCIGAAVVTRLLSGGQRVIQPPRHPEQAPDHRALTDTPLSGRLLSSEAKRRAAAERHPLRCLTTPEDLASAAVWLLIDAGRVTGQIIPVDAGLPSLRLL